MSKEIIAALILAGATIMAALIALFKKKPPEGNTTIVQKTIGTRNTQIGIQQNIKMKKDSHEQWG